MKEPPEKTLKILRAGRHRARTDLRWLCQNILNRIAPFYIFREGVHDKLCAHLQQFDAQGKDEFLNGMFVYSPVNHDPARALPPGPRRRLLLAPRGWYKTSFNVIAHSIQWILNFPNVSGLIIHASQEVAEHMLVSIKQQFQMNPVMRFFFPEFCPPSAMKEWGTRQYFTIPARTIHSTAPTLSVAGIESVRTGMHYHFLKFTDIVDEKNSATREQCRKIIYSYGMCRNLLISPSYWIDIEGTRYDYGDLYGRIIDEWMAEEKEGREHEFQVFVMGCYKKDLEKERFTPDELAVPYALDENGQKISRFPEEFPVDKLEKMRKDPVTGEAIFAAQQLNDPAATEDVEQVFPLKYIRWKAEEDLAKVPVAYYITTVDTAEKASERSDYTSIMTCGWDRMGRCYVVDVRLGKYLPEQIIDHIFLVHQKYKPRKIYIEETGFTRGLMHGFGRVRDTLKVYPNVELLKRDTHVAKQERIMGIQPFYKNGMIYFSTGLPDFVKEQLLHQLSRFPKYQHDDLLDTLADQFQHKQYYGPLEPSPSEKEIEKRYREMLIFRKEGWEQVFGKEEDSSMWKGLGAL